MSVKLTLAVFVIGLGWGAPVMAEQLPGSEWQPVELMASNFEPVSEIFLRFEQDGRFFGNGGCNTFRGQFLTNGDSVLFGPAATTMMACPDDIAKQEFDFLQALNGVRQFERKGLNLTLSDAQGEVVLRLKQCGAD